MKKRPSIAMLTALLAVVFAAGIGVYSSYIGMKIYQESSDNLFESFSQISKTFTLYAVRAAKLDRAESVGRSVEEHRQRRGC